jgi:hypothetical protein
MTVYSDKDIRAIALDPGGVTGITIAVKEDKTLRVHPFQQSLTPAEMQVFLENHAKPPTWVICESFEFRKYARAGLDLTPAHLIGVVMAVCSDDRLYMQTASYAKSGYFTDRTLKSKNLYIPAQPHAMDSLRHFLQWFTFGPGYRFNNDPDVMLWNGIDE